MGAECVYDESTDKYYLFYSAQDLHGDSKYFDTHEERALYHELEAEVNTFDYAAVEEKINEAKLMYSEAETYEGLTEEQLKKVKNSIVNYYSNKEALDENDKLTEAEKQQSLCEYGRERLLEIYAVKIHYTHANGGYSLGVAVSDSPAGPFVQYTNLEGQPGYDSSNRTIDLENPFITHEDLYAAALQKRDTTTYLFPSTFILTSIPFRAKNTSISPTLTAATVFTAWKRAKTGRTIPSGKRLLIS